MLIKCPDCGHAVSDSATACPNCGYPVAEHKKELEPVPTAAEHPAPAPAPVLPTYAEPKHPRIGCALASAILGTIFTVLSMYVAAAYLLVGIDWQEAGMRAAIIATALCWAGVFVGKRGLVLASSIIYTLAAILFPTLLIVSVPALVCGYVGFSRMKYERS